MDDLTTLADRLEAASGPDLELDVTVWRTANPDTYAQWEDVSRGLLARGRDEERRQVTLLAKAMTASPKFTASLDAALSLIPDDCVWGVSNSDDPHPSVWKASVMPRYARAGECINGKSPALALCAAALRARAAMKDTQ